MLTPEEKERFTSKLMRFEGTKRNAQGQHIVYCCSAGALTIGYGHNLDALPVPGITVQSALSEDQARRLLAADIHRAEVALQKTLPFVKKLDAVRYATLLDMAFNMGIGKLLTFKNTLRDVERGNYVSAAARMMKSKWAFQVGDGPGGRFDRAEELAQQMRTGQWV